MIYQKHTLENGLRLITVPISGFPSVTVLITVGIGSRYEEKQINGISHFLEHMAFKGTKKRPTALEIASIVDGIGGESNAFTSKDYTGYYIKSAVEHLPFVVDILADILLNSRLDQMEIEKERGVIIEEINMYEDLPMRRVAELYEKLLYGDSRLGRFIAGEKDIIRNLQRKDFISYMDKFYGPGNTIVTIAGGFNDGFKNSVRQAQDGQETRIRNLIEKYFSSWRKKRVEKYQKADNKQDKPAVYLQHKDTDQAHLCLGVRAYNLSHPSRYALAVLTTILGGGMSSRLFSEVREKRGLAYYVRAMNEKYQDVGHFVTHAGVDLKRIDEAIKVILAEFVKIREKKVLAKELKKAKEYLKGRFTLSLEDSKTVAALFATSDLLEGKIHTPQEIMEKIDAVTDQEVQKVAQDIFRTNSLNLAIIGNYKNSERFKELLSL